MSFAARDKTKLRCYRWIIQNGHVVIKVILYCPFLGEGLLLTHPGAGEHRGPTGTIGAVGSCSAAPGEQVGVSGALLKGTSSVDED